MCNDLFIQINYAKILGTRLKLWHIKNESPFAGSARCSVCGDSAKRKTLCRFHVREYKGTLFTTCFNCGLSLSLEQFLKTYHTDLYSEYKLEKYRLLGNVEPVIKSAPTIAPEPTRTASAAFKSLPLVLVSDLEKTHPARSYVESRKLPEYPFQYAPEFFKFSSQYNTSITYDRDEPRLVIPFFDRSGNVFAYQGRDLSGTAAQKYITITVDEKVPKIFGIDRVSSKEKIIIVEGPIDSLFIKNSVAAVNASLVATAKKLERVINKQQLVIALDNEPRNKIILDHYQEAIKAGYNVVIWPKSCEGIKDINDMVLRGLNPHEIIKNNTYSGLLAQIEFQKFKRI